MSNRVRVAMLAAFCLPLLIGTGQAATSGACAARAQAFQDRVDKFNRRCSGVGSVSQAALYQSCAAEKAALSAEQNKICAECPGCQK
jgi:hypothetical protein